MKLPDQRCWPLVTRPSPRSLKRRISQLANTSHPMDRPVNSYLIENMAQEFWEMADGADGTSRLPRDIKTAITLALPLEVYSVPALRVNHVLAWTRRVKITHRIRGQDRRLHGCLLANRGKGIIFVDASDAD